MAEIKGKLSGTAFEIFNYATRVTKGGKTLLGVPFGHENAAANFREALQRIMPDSIVKWGTSDTGLQIEFNTKLLGRSRQALPLAVLDFLR